MDVLIERCAGLDVHRDTVVATVRRPGPRWCPSVGDADVHHDDRATRSARGSVDRAGGDAGRDGIDRYLLSSGPLRSGGRAPGLSDQRRASTERAGPQDTQQHLILPTPATSPAAPGHIGVRPARPRPGTVPLGPDVWRLQRPLREHPAAGGSGGGAYRIHWLGRPDRRVSGRAGGLRAARWRRWKRPARHQPYLCWRHGRALTRIGQAGRHRPSVWLTSDEPRVRARRGLRARPVARGRRTSRLRRPQPRRVRRARRHVRSDPR
jgi:hypothetical protein